MGRFITPEGLKQLDHYHYKPGTATSLDKALASYWNYVVTLVPMWVAPNALTLAGWLVLLSSTLVILYHDYTFQKEIPAWCFYWAAASLWIYSTLDAIDGKQARRTQSSSALGQLFDHGCDAFCVSFLIINLAAAAHFEDTYAFVLFIAGYSAFWIANWKEYNTGVLMTSVGEVGVTEMQVIAIVCFLISAVFGQSVWEFALVDVLPTSVFNTLDTFLPSSALKLPFGGMVAYYIGIMIIIMTCFELSKTLWETKSFKSMKECFSLFVLMICCCSFPTGECPSFFPLPDLVPGFKASGPLPTHVHKLSTGGKDVMRTGVYTDGDVHTTGTWTPTADDPGHIIDVGDCTYRGGCCFVV